MRVRVGESARRMFATTGKALEETLRIDSVNAERLRLDEGSWLQLSLTNAARPLRARPEAVRASLCALPALSIRFLAGSAVLSPIQSLKVPSYATFAPCVSRTRLWPVPIPCTFLRRNTASMLLSWQMTSLVKI